MIENKHSDADLGWPTSSYCQRASFAEKYPTHLVRPTRDQIPSSNSATQTYIRYLGSALAFSVMLTTGLGRFMVNQTEPPAPVTPVIPPIERKTVVLSPNQDLNTLTVEQGPDVKTETLIIETVEGDTVVRTQITISGENSGNPEIRIDDTGTTVNFPSR